MRTIKLSAPLLLAATTMIFASATVRPAEPRTALTPETPVPAVQEQQFENMPDAAKAAGDDDLICRQQKVLGSNLPKRVCATKSEWKKAHDVAQDEMLNKARKNPTLPREH